MDKIPVYTNKEIRKLSTLIAIEVFGWSIDSDGRWILPEDELNGFITKYNRKYTEKEPFTLSNYEDIIFTIAKLKVSLVYSNPEWMAMVVINGTTYEGSDKNLYFALINCLLDSIHLNHIYFAENI